MKLIRFNFNKDNFRLMLRRGVGAGECAGSGNDYGTGGTFYPNDFVGLSKYEVENI
jgi:hypothetical protein